MYKIKICESFKKQMRKLCKKNRILFHEIRYALLSFHKEENICIGKGVYKVRLKGFNKGKSGGYRLYLLVVEVNNLLAPICIYSKNDKSNLTLNELSILVEKINRELDL